MMPQFIGAGSLSYVQHDALMLLKLIEARSPDHIINHCANRYHFLVTLRACAMYKRPALLPPNAIETVFDEILPVEQSKLIVDDQLLSKLCNYTISTDKFLEDIDPNQVVMRVFTSGSTGTPKPIDKAWDDLASRAKTYNNALWRGAVDIVSMVPSQHMYGLETSVFTALMPDCRVYVDTVTYPHTLQRALSACDNPRVLISTPTLLRALLKTGTSLPPLDLIVSATSALDPQLAADCQKIFCAPVREIYGFSEAGSVAYREMDSDIWHTLHGVTVQNYNDKLAVFLNDKFVTNVEDSIELLSATSFRFIGRPSDLIKIGGKRASLSGITHKLCQVEGVEDAYVYMSPHRERLEAAVVAENLSTRDIQVALSTTFDPKFIPRHIRFVDNIPRTEMGKVLQSSIDGLSK